MTGAARIELCAPMGVGKTTLALGLQALGFHAAHERADLNPHLRVFYKTFSRTAAYKKDRWFVGHLDDVIAGLPRGKTAVMDFSGPMCRAYVDAGVNSPENAARLQRAFDRVAKKHGPADLLVLLQLPLPEQAARIRARSRDIEEGVPLDYLRRLADAFERRVLEAEAAGQKVLRVDARRDFREPAEVAKLAQEIATALKGPGPVTRFRGAHHFLSNFWPAPVVFDGITFPTVENAYQAAKCKTREERLAFAAMTPGEAKQRGGDIALRGDWADIRLPVMRDLIWQKFQQPQLRQQLLGTGNRTLIEGNDWNDRFWGVSGGQGDNNLGKTLMDTRRYLTQGMTLPPSKLRGLRA